MVGKKSGKALLRDEGQYIKIKPFHNAVLHALTHPQGLERTDNNMDLSSWPVIPAINQKNYYTFVL